MDIQSICEERYIYILYTCSDRELEKTFTYLHQYLNKCGKNNCPEVSAESLPARCPSGNPSVATWLSPSRKGCRSLRAVPLAMAIPGWSWLYFWVRQLQCHQIFIVNLEIQWFFGGWNRNPHWARTNPANWIEIQIWSHQINSCAWHIHSSRGVQLLLSTKTVHPAGFWICFHLISPRTQLLCLPTGGHWRRFSQQWWCFETNKTRVFSIYDLYYA